MLSDRELLTRLAAGTDLTDAEAGGAMQRLMRGEMPDPVIGGFLLGLAAKGETVAEIKACVEVMRAHATRITPSTSVPMVDLCGTGGAPTKT